MGLLFEIHGNGDLILSLIVAPDNQGIKVSIIIPVYEVFDYIERCVLSVMNQTYENIECIIVDDATPDDSIIKCERLIHDYNGPIRFRIIQHNDNRGLSAARNTGTAEAKGDYIFYLDSDDVITSDCIELLMAPILNDTTFDVVMGNKERLPDGHPLPSTPPRKLQYQEIRSLDAVRNYFYGGKSTVMTAWNKLIKRDFISRCNLTFKEGVIWEDTLWTFHLMKYLEHLCILKEVTYYYCRRPNSICTGTDIKVKRQNWGIVFNEISGNFTPGDSNREARHYLRRFCRQYVHCPNDDLYRMTARNFRQELSLKQNPVECMLLFGIGALSKAWIGRKCLQCMLRVHKAYWLLRHE